MIRCFCAVVLTAAALLLPAVAASAQEPTKVIYGLSIPDKVGGLVYRQTVEYESKSPDLGYGLRFSGRPGWIVDVYIYDLGLKTIPVDVESSIIKNQLKQAKGDVFELGKRGTYANVADRGDFTIPDDGKARFICSSFSYLRGERVDIGVESYLCLSSWNNKFVKVRMTAPNGTMSRSDATDFVKAWIALLRRS
jgi:hypothetical protein